MEQECYTSPLRTILKPFLEFVLLIHRALLTTCGKECELTLQPAMVPSPEPLSSTQALTRAARCSMPQKPQPTLQHDPG